MAALAVWSEIISGQNSLITGKIQGIFPNQLRIGMLRLV
jgi:hypothetical protein